MATSKKQAKPTSDHKSVLGPFMRALMAGPGFVLSERDPRSTPGYDGNKKSCEKLLAATVPELADLQQQLYA